MSQSSFRRMADVMGPEVIRHLGRIAPVLFGGALLTILAGLVLIYVHYQTNVNPLVLLVDPVAESGLPAYTGVYSNVGILMWWSAATVCTLCGALLWSERRVTQLSRFLLVLGLYSAVLCLDDMFLLHEEAGLRLAQYLDLSDNLHVRSILEAPFFLAYAALSVYVVRRFWSVIRDTDFLLLGAAVGSLASSAGIDVAVYMFPGNVSRPVVADIAEDLLKLNGIVLWLAYAVRTGCQRVRSRMNQVGRSRGTRRATSPC